MKNNKYIFFSIFLSCIAISSSAQDLDKIGKKDMVKISGGLNYSSIFYNANGIQNRRQPFTYFLNGNVTANFIGITLPFTFNYSNNQVNYSQPYNIQSFNPTYRWAKGYAGITSMNFSQYTMANHIFAGGGIELSPKNFKFAALYGRFKKATEYDFQNSSDINMAYKRMGWGASAAYEKSGQSIKLIYFSAKDDARSLSFVPINTNVTPMENTVVSLAGKTTLYKQITVEGEYALSGLTRNSSSPTDVNVPPRNQLPLIFSPNATSQFFAAYKASLGYRLKLFGVNLNYERVAPDYKTLGAYYFNNDLENFTIAPSLTLLKGKLNLNVNTGLQRNNLNNDKLNTTSRWVGSTNINFAPNKQWNVTSSFSNFSSYTKQKPQNDPFYRNTLDTLNFYQLSQSSMLSIAYNFGAIKTKQNLMFTGNYQVTGQNQGAIANPGLFGTTTDIKLPSKIINANFGHNLMFTNTKTSITTAININNSLLKDFNILYYGPNLNLSQGFINNKLKLSVGTSYNQILTNKIKTNEVFNHRLSANYAPKLNNEKIGKFNFTLSATYLQKLKSVKNAISFNEFTGNLGLNYNF
ncbi:hypothetical protein [Sediminibacterium sp.]|uniref:hypothetical protein n=1 Tax=Sediminibacterium sp. TaxID=1917865 RepID=UPI002736AA5A|nr:hypothetical protein [Sediminibacterium sp.]MDP3567393.1 hypothetical protein [Sediminibacterium sp.]